MRPGHFRKHLLLLALILGQWLTFAHALQHPVLSAGEQLCQIGVHAQGLDAGATVAIPVALVFANQVAALVHTPRSSVAFHPSSQHLIRGPPARLV